MKRMTAGDLQALELLMQTTPGFEHYDSGVDAGNIAADGAGTDAAQSRNGKDRRRRP